jgi:hypothetical protein
MSVNYRMADILDWVSVGRPWPLAKSRKGDIEVRHRVNQLQKNAGSMNGLEKWWPFRRGVGDGMAEADRGLCKDW